VKSGSGKWMSAGCAEPRGRLSTDRDFSHQLPDRKSLPTLAMLSDTGVIAFDRVVQSPLFFGDCSGIAAIHARTSATPSSCTSRFPNSGIITPGWVEAIRYAIMDRAGWPGTISYARPPDPIPAATGGL
jgi:hypothetical protein